MRTLTLRHSGLTISRVIGGCWQAGRDQWPGAKDISSIAALRAAFDHGVTTFDTAEDYGNGHSEQILRQALQSQRDHIVIATKVSWDHLRRDQIMAACERSLTHLGTDRIDLYQIHWPAGTFGSPSVPLEESMDALLRLQQQGKIRAIGVSNFSLAQLKYACSLGPIDTLQPPYSLLWRQAEQQLIPWCQFETIAVLAYAPLAQGLLTGTIGPTLELAPGDNRRDNRLFQPPTLARALAVVDALRPIADSIGVSLAQLALAWVTQSAGVAAIAGLRTPSHAIDNAGAGTLILDQSLQTRLDLISRLIQEDHDSPVMWTWNT